MKHKKQDHLPPETLEEIRKEFFNAKPWNHFFFGRIMEMDRDFCQDYLNHVFRELQKIYGADQIVIPQVLYSKAEMIIPPAESSGEEGSHKICRPDVTIFADMPALIFQDLQNSMKNANDGRWRMYVESGDHWNMIEREPWSIADAKRAIMVVICTFDFCKNGRHINVVERRSLWKSERLPETQVNIVYLSSRGTYNDINPELREFLEYLETGVIRNGNRLAIKYQKHMKQLKEDKAWEEKYMKMTYEERMRIGSYEEGMDRGRSEGRNEGRDERSQEIARNMLSDHEPEDKIQKFTGLSIPEIRKLMK